MAGLGLGPDWQCLFANDIDPKKAKSYRANRSGGAELLLKSIARVAPHELPGSPDLAWASFPCQDLSLAGKGAGLEGARSGMFSPFWELMRTMKEQGRGPKLIVVENVRGLVTSRKGADFAALAAAFSELGYKFGAMIIDAVHFLPQSRPRFFLIGVHPDLKIPEELSLCEPDLNWHPSALVNAQKRLPDHVADQWIWWRLQAPKPRNTTLASIIEKEPTGVEWHSKSQTEHLLNLMTEVNAAKIEEAKQSRGTVVGTVYRRTRLGPDGIKRQRAEVRFDGVAGCLRTPSGGSSRQTIMLVANGKVRSRLLSPREAAMLMGLPDEYELPASYNDAYKLAGDGVAVPVVRYLASKIFQPILNQNSLALAA